MLPAGLAYSYLGYAGREVATGGAQAVKAGMIALGLLVMAAFLPRFIARLRNRPR